MTQGTLVDPGSATQEIARRFKEPDAFARIRLQALESYKDAPLPQRVQHLWRYTAPEQFAPPAETLADKALAEWNSTGHVHLAHAEDMQKQGVTVMDLHQALRDKPDLVERHLGKIIGGSVDKNGRGKFEALNLGLWTIGTLIHVPKNVRVEEPCHLRLTLPLTPPRGVPHFLATRVLVVLEEGAELTLIEECEGGFEGLVLNSVVELDVGPAGRLTHVAMQDLEKSVKYHVAQRASVARDAHVLTATTSLGGGVTKSDFGSYVTGPGANVELVGFLLGEGKQHFDHHTVHNHHAGHAYSNLDFKVVLKDKAQSAYTGLIRIEEDAPESEAYQENRNLLLNDGTKAESIPELEILTDEVSCSHGATVGTLDPEHLFYLMCRGLDRHAAIRLIVGGFVEPTLSRLPENMRERLSRQVEERIQDL